MQSDRKRQLASFAVQWLVVTSVWLTACTRPVSLGSLCLTDDNCTDGTDGADGGGMLGGMLDASMQPALDASICLASSDAAACTCDAGLNVGSLAHWPLDEMVGLLAAETSGRATVGILQGYATGNPWVPGELSGALSFDGSAQRVQVGAVSGDVKTLSLWLKPGSTEVSSDHTLVQLPSSHGPLDQWTDPQNAYFDDGLAATAASLIGMKEQHWGGFHLTPLLPSGASIQGITVTVDSSNLGVLGNFGVELSSDGGQSHTASHYNWGQLIAGSNLRQAGGDDKLWGRNWTVDDFSDDHLRVWASFGGIANSMGIDYLGVEVQYAQQSTTRTIFSLSPSTYVAFAGLDGKSIATYGWPGSAVFVNGQASGALADGWNHVVIVSQVGVSASDVQLGHVDASSLSFPYQGLMDDVALFSVALTPAQLDSFHQSSACP